MPLKSSSTDFQKMRTIFFYTLIFIFGLAIVYLFRPFFYPIFWAAIIAIMFYPLYQLLHKYLKSKGLSSFITLVVVFTVIFLPLVLLTTLIINQSVMLYQLASEGNLLVKVKDIGQWLQGSTLAPYIEYIRTNWADYAQTATKTISLFLFDNLKNITGISLQFLFMLFIMFYSLYYFLKDGPRMLKRLMHLSPLGDKYEEMLFQRFTSTARATLKGTVLMGLIQGTVGGILFWIAGVQRVLVWAVIMAAVSIIPALGTFIVWFPAGIIMLALGNVWQGLVILLGGFLIVSTIDNFLKPILVGKDIEMHPLLVLFSTLGGILIFGASGIVIGPVLCALFLAIISIYDEHYKTELERN